jgi:2-hydroxy-3-keto-5-methylthiopentenyl-1-phosphate phosphatase
MSLKLFVDFDGTITTEDVGNQFFLTFGGPVCSDLVQQYHEGRLTAQECFRREIQAIGAISLKDLEVFVARQSLTPGFRRFVDFCRKAEIEVAIVSDGLDFYIRDILQQNGVGGVQFYSNIVRFSPSGDGRADLTLEFPYSCSECGRCACCKRNIVLTSTGEQDIIGYIGEGFSDQCAAEYADIVFAKDDLQRYCQEKNISYYPYQDFDDVVERLTLLLKRTRLRKRRRAELKRREAFVREA